MDQTLINRIVEAALLAANQPLTPAQLQGLFSLDDPAPDGTYHPHQNARCLYTDGVDVARVVAPANDDRLAVAATALLAPLEMVILVQQTRTEHVPLETIHSQIDHVLTLFQRLRHGGVDVDLHVLLEKQPLPHQRLRGGPHPPLRDERSRPGRRGAAGGRLPGEDRSHGRHAQGHRARLCAAGNSECRV